MRRICTQLAPADQATAFRLWWRARVQRVVLIFSTDAAGAIRERIWHPSQGLAELPDGRVKLTLQVAAPEELERWLLGFAADVEVQEPDTLAARLRARHANAAGVATTMMTAEDRPRSRPIHQQSRSRDNGPAQDARHLPARRARRRSPGD